jgi:hypothetical protein
MSTKPDPTSLVTVGTEVTTPLSSASTKGDSEANEARTQGARARAFTNLARTFTAQVEALKRYRTVASRRSPWSV